VPLAAPQTGDQQSGKAIAPRMALDQVTAAAGAANTVVTAAAFRKGDVATVDPRWNLAGDGIVWLVRSVSAGGATKNDGTRAETVSLVDDATGKLIDSRPQKSDAAYQPARLWQTATIHGLDCCAGNEYAFYRVETDGGTLLYEGMVRGGESGTGDSTVMGGWEGLPLVLPAGRYSIAGWLATYDSGVTGAPQDECSTQVTLQPLGDVALDAEFPAGGSCTFRPAPSASPGS